VEPAGFLKMANSRTKEYILNHKARALVYEMHDKHVFSGMVLCGVGRFMV